MKDSNGSAAGLRRSVGVSGKPPYVQGDPTPDDACGGTDQKLLEPTRAMRLADDDASRK